MAITEQKIIKKLPATDTGHGVRCFTPGKKEFFISYNPTSGVHTLWEVIPGQGYGKIRSANTPYDLYPLVKD